MRLISAFFTLLRLPNLLFIVLTQVVFQFCIYLPLYRHALPADDFLRFSFLVIASVCIAAAGYVINDYFDINIDEINKPGRMVVDRVINRRWAIAWHFIFNTLGLAFTILALPVIEKWYLVLANLGCMALLWFYSTNFKKDLLIGNIVISLLTSWVILVVFFSKVTVQNAIDPGSFTQPKFFRIAFLYAGFAFICSLIREAVKDMEDIKGDARYGSRSMPIAWGLNAAKVYVAVWMIVLIVLLVVLGIYILQFRWWWLLAYATGCILLPLLLLFRKLFSSGTPEDFHQLSTGIKRVMLAGILSMIFFYFYL